MITFATRIKELRLQYGWSQPELADKVGVTKQTVSLWERGKIKPDFKRFEDLAKIFDVSVYYLIGATDDRKPLPVDDDFFLTKCSVQEDDKILEGLVKQLAQLSHSSRRIIAAAIAEAYRLDRERGTLIPEDAHVVYIKSTGLEINAINIDEDES